MTDTGLIELAERCEKATGPDRLADQAIGWIVGTQRWRGSSVTEYDGPAYTASLDAAMTLVPEECGYRLHAPTPDAFGKALPGVFGVELWWVPAFPGKVGGKSLASMALALCAAALKARAVLTPPSEPTEK